MATGLVSEGATKAIGATGVATAALIEWAGVSGWATGVEAELAKAATTPAKTMTAVKVKNGSFFMMVITG